MKFNTIINIVGLYWLMTFSSSLFSAELTNLDGRFYARTSEATFDLNKVNNGGILDRVEVVAFLYKSKKEKFYVPTNERYIVTLTKDQYPYVIGSFNGFFPKFKYWKVGGAGILGIKYSTGANLRILRLYCIENDAIKGMESPQMDTNVEDDFSVSVVGDRLYVRTKNTKRTALNSWEEINSNFRFDGCDYKDSTVEKLKKSLGDMEKGNR